MNALNKCTIFTEEEMNNMESEIRRFQDMCTSETNWRIKMKKQIRCVIVDIDGMYTQYMTIEELHKKKIELSKYASQFLKEGDYDHLLYYRDERNQEDEIEVAYLYYNMLGFTEEEFWEKVVPFNSRGYIGAIHKIK